MIRADTSVCCVIGDPVAHSLSPLIHNVGFRALNLNFVYVAFRVRDIKLAVYGIRGLGIRGVSVTIPHKVSAMMYLDKVDDIARQIGAINTIVNDGGVLKGYNTDCAAALRALEEKTPAGGKRAVILGAGGTAMSIAAGLKKSGARVLILARAADRAQVMARLVGADDSGGFDRLSAIAEAEILVNATPVGMTPRADESLVPVGLLHAGLTVFDVVYNPMETRLIAEAKKVGCAIIYGYRMFLHQAAAQFELFTGHEAPLADMEKALIEALEGGRVATADGG